MLDVRHSLEGHLRGFRSAVSGFAREIQSVAWEPGFAGEADVLFREKVEYEVQGIEEAVRENRSYAILGERELWHGVTSATVGATGAVIGSAYDLAPLSGGVMGAGEAAATSSRASGRT